MEKSLFCFVTILFFIVCLFNLWFAKEIHTKFTILFSKENTEVLDVYQLKFNGYLKDFNKNYHGEEYERRFSNFKANLKEIAKLNALEGNKVFGLTKFSDMSKKEFAEKMLLKPISSSCTSKYKKCGPKGPKLTSDESTTTINYDEGVPDSFDWRDSPGVVKPVLNQKYCLGCWAFSIVGVMESMAAIRKKDYKSRSIEELLDCSEDNDGCRGGSVSIAVDYMCDFNMQIVTDEEYPLTLSADKSCKPMNYTGIRLTEYHYQCNLKESRIVHQIAKHGPLIAAVDASNWLNYIGGVIQRACSQFVANHVIQIVGYVGYGGESETPIPYYIVRNSLGKDFGDHGYVKIAMMGDICGIAEQVTRIDVI